MNLKSENLNRLRFLSLADGISYLVLLCIAMPLKYGFDMPLAVRIVGSLHGLIYILLILVLAEVFFRKMLDFKYCLLVFIAAFIPAAPFFLDRVLKAQDEN